MVEGLHDVGSRRTSGTGTPSGVLTTTCLQPRRTAWGAGYYAPRAHETFASGYRSPVAFFFSPNSPDPILPFLGLAVCPIAARSSWSFLLVEDGLRLAAEAPLRVALRACPAPVTGLAGLVLRHLVDLVLAASCSCVRLAPGDVHHLPTRPRRVSSGLRDYRGSNLRRRSSSSLALRRLRARRRGPALRRLDSAAKRSVAGARSARSQTPARGCRAGSGATRGSHEITAGLEGCLRC